jgi:flagellar biosynthesis/type III secretory pathway chaperone
MNNFKKYLDEKLSLEYGLSYVLTNETNNLKLFIWDKNQQTTDLKLRWIVGKVLDYLLEEKQILNYQLYYSGERETVDCVIWI